MTGAPSRAAKHPTRGFSRGVKRYDSSLKLSNANEASVSRRTLLLVHAEAKQAGSMRLEPGFGALRISRQVPDRSPERGGMVHMQEMRCFMRREIIEDETGRHDQAPGKAECARRGARPPPARRIPQGDLARSRCQLFRLGRQRRL